MALLEAEALHCAGHYSRPLAKHQIIAIHAQQLHAQSSQKCDVQAMAAHNTGGIVIVQVERVVASGTLSARLVHLPGAIVDKVLLCYVINLSPPNRRSFCASQIALWPGRYERPLTGDWALRE